MINGALQIIGDVPGKHLDPLLLAQSQWNDSLGFMMIAYSKPSPNPDATASPFYDLFFLRGSHIYECARMNCDLRFQLHLEVALQTFKDSGREDSTRVYLFAAAGEILDRFHSTFVYEPCLKVQLEGLSKKQIHALLTGTKCKKGIIECNEFIQILPSLDLKDVASIEDLAQYGPPFKHGRILLYDIEKNKELIEVRHASQSSRSIPGSDQASLNLWRTAIRSHHAPHDNSTDDLFSAANEKETEDITSFINKILNSGPSAATPEGHVSRATPSNELRESSVKTPQPDSFVITHQESEHSLAPNTIPCPCPPIHGRDTKHGRDHRPPRKTFTRRAKQTTSEPQHNEPPPELSDYTKLFDRTFRSFRQQVFDSFGDKCDTVIAESERKLRILTPEFDLQLLNENTAILVLDLIEDIAGRASFMKRSRLRQAALTLVADLYNKQYELLEKHHVIDKVEQFYYRLKK